MILALMAAMFLASPEAPAPAPDAAVEAEAAKATGEDDSGAVTEEATAGGATGGEVEPAAAAATPAASTVEPTVEKQSTPSKWWNGEESIYDNGFYLGLGFDGRSLQSGAFQTKGAVMDGKAIRGGTTAGFRGEIGSMGRYFGVMILGASYHVTGDGAELETTQGSRYPVSVKALDLRLLQPRLRYAFRRFEVAAQVGPVAHIGWARVDAIPGGILPANMRRVGESSVYGNVAAEVGGTLRFYPLSFLYVEGGYGHSFKLFDLVGETTGMQGFHGGAGLSF